MPLDQTRPIIYLITSGKTTSGTTPDSNEFSSVLHLVEAAVASQIPLIQLREKELSARVLYELASSAVAITRGSASRLLVNDRFDIAIAVGAAGVHLTGRSLAVDVVRNFCGSKLLIGASTHSVSEAVSAKAGGADFVVFGPVFETASKLGFGEPQGTGRLQCVKNAVGTFPVVAIGGISEHNALECFKAGADGVAAISLLNDPVMLGPTVEKIWKSYTVAKKGSE